MFQDTPSTVEADEAVQETRWSQAREAWIGRQRRGSTRRAYQTILDGFLGFSGKPAWAATTEEVRRWRGWLEQENYATSTIRTYLATLASFYAAAVGNGLAKSNPVEAELLPKASPYASGRYLTEEEEEALLGAIDRETRWGLRDYALILCLLRSGRRTSEILGLRWGDFEVGKAGVGYRAGRLEGCRWGRLDWEVWAAICEYLEGCGRAEGIGEEEAIFTPLTDVAGRVERLYGKEWRKHGLSEVSVGRLIQMYALWAGLPAEEITPKALRYTAGARKWKAACTLEELRDFMGHTDVDVTRKFVRRLEE